MHTLAAQSSTWSDFLISPRELQLVATLHYFCMRTTAGHIEKRLHACMHARIPSLTELHYLTGLLEGHLNVVSWIQSHHMLSWTIWQVLFEGIPTFPEVNRFWKICEKYKVNFVHAIVLSCTSSSCSIQNFLSEVWENCHLPSCICCASTAFHSRKSVMCWMAGDTILHSAYSHQIAHGSWRCACRVGMLSFPMLPTWLQCAFWPQKNATRRFCTALIEIRTIFDVKLPNVVIRALAILEQAGHID